MSEEYRIYVACLASYNAGHLHGEWITIDGFMNVGDIQMQVNKMFRASPEPDAEEWAIHDYDMGGVKIEEYESFERILEIVAALEEHEHLAAVMDYFSDLDEAISALEDNFCGVYDSRKDWAEENLETHYPDLPSEIAWHIDMDSYASELENSYTVIDLPNYEILVLAA